MQRHRHRARGRTTGTAAVAAALCLAFASPAQGAPPAGAPPAGAATADGEGPPSAAARARDAQEAAKEARSKAQRRVDDARAAEQGEPRGRLDAKAEGGPAASARRETPRPNAASEANAAAPGPQGRIGGGPPSTPPGRPERPTEATDPEPAPAADPPARREAGITPGDAPRGMRARTDLVLEREEAAPPRQGGTTGGRHEPIADVASSQPDAAPSAPSAMGPDPTPGSVGGAPDATPDTTLAAPPADAPSEPRSAAPPPELPRDGERDTALIERTRRAVDGFRTSLPPRTLSVSGTLAAVAALYLVSLHWLDRGRLPMARPEEGRETDAQLVL